MTKMITDYLDKLFPNPHTELNYHQDYELLIAVMLSAQTTDQRVNQVTKILFAQYPSLESLANANLDDLKKIIHPIGTYNKKATNIIAIAKSLQSKPKVPNDRSYLESLPGVGRKTTNLVLATLYNEPYMAVDTHVSRVSKRLGLVNQHDDVIEIERKLTKQFDAQSLNKIHHQLVLFGRYYCKAKNPQCLNCPFRFKECKKPVK